MEHCAGIQRSLGNIPIKSQLHQEKKLACF